ncbi:hypothetical protein B0H17DRAFT_13889 [Mycena rosella]|uniref:Uncharacterized protein n=1 Tax=Mycena rosella TaxID=1033263 RepID=A0AAD7M7M2_MYCRO|nr:hypothetical protein B0H17DRAFT_13889 [Mycena rosella]
MSAPRAPWILADPRGARVLHREAKGPPRAHAVRHQSPLPPPQRGGSRCRWARRAAGQQRLPAEPAGGLHARAPRHRLGALRAQRPDPPQRSRPPAPAPTPAYRALRPPAARARILDPVLAVYGEPEPSPSDALTSPADHKNATANGNGKDECAGPRMPPRGPSGLFTRRPRVRVDVDTTGNPNADPNADGGSTTAIDSASTRGTRTVSPRCPSPPSASAMAMEVQGERDAEEIPMALAKPVRRISTKLQHQNSDCGAPLVTRARRKSGAAAIPNNTSTNASVGTRTSARAQGRQVAAPTPTPVAATAPATAPKQQRLKLILPARSAPARALPAASLPAPPANVRAKKNTEAPSPAALPRVRTPG